MTGKEDILDRTYATILVLTLFSFNESNFFTITFNSINRFRKILLIQVEYLTTNYVVNILISNCKYFIMVE